MVQLNTKIGSLELKNPVMTASGTFGYGTEYADFMDISRLGAIIVKGTTLNPRQGNPYPRMAETPSGMLNAVGLQNKGVDYFVDHIYPEVRKNPSSIYSFLLVAGYLRCTEIIPQSDGNFMCHVSIPNKEISFVYAKEIIARLTPEHGESTATAIQQAIFERDTETLRENIESYLLETISVFDTGSEAFYQGLMIGLCAILNNRYTVRSNRESGLGRFDIQLWPMDTGIPGFIFELKASKKRSESLETLALEALQQIDGMRYEHEMRSGGVKEIIKVGIAFRGKEMSIRTV